MPLRLQSPLSPFFFFRLSNSRSTAGSGVFHGRGSGAGERTTHTRAPSQVMGSQGPRPLSQGGQEERDQAAPSFFGGWGQKGGNLRKRKEYRLGFDIPGIYTTVPDLHPRSRDRAPG